MARSTLVLSLAVLLGGCSLALSDFSFGGADGGGDGGTTDASPGSDAGPRDAGDVADAGGDAANDAAADGGPVCPADCVWGCDADGCNDPVQVAAGENHTCVRRARGDVWCWGDNEFGQIGDGTIDMRVSPVAVTGLVDAIELTAGGDHTCAVRATGRIVCWGRNDHGQLGTGETSTLPTMSPVPVVSISSANSVAAGCNHTCAVIAGNTLNCWGFNGGGQVGDGTMTTPRASPRFVMTISGAEQVSGGFLHSCARLGDGSARCWGFNDEGQVGDGTTTPRDVPVAVSSISAISDIDAATCWNSSCAVDADGNAWCWGANGNGQLGDNTMTPRDAPVAVRSLDDAQQVSVGNEHACAVRDSGAVVCWGNNSNGQLGDGTTFIRETFVSVDSALPTRANSVSAGGQHTCALLDDGDVYCWGANDVGQVGDGSSIERLTPVRVPAPGE